MVSLRLGEIMLFQTFANGHLNLINDHDWCLPAAG